MTELDLQTLTNLFTDRFDPQFPLTESFELGAQEYGMTAIELARTALYESVQLPVVAARGVKKKGTADQREFVTTLPGHKVGSLSGPRGHARIMVVGKWPGEEEMIKLRNFIGPSGDELRGALKLYNVPIEEAYLTNLVKFMPPDGIKSRIRADHIKDCAWLLGQELFLIQPKFLFILGSDASKWFFGPKGTVTRMRGAVLGLDDICAGLGKYPDDMAQDGPNATKVVVGLHPVNALREASQKKLWLNDAKLFADVTHGVRKPGQDKPNDAEYRYVDNTVDLQQLINQLISENRTYFAVDCEWGGRNYREGWLRTIQFSWDEGKAAVIVLYRAGKKATSLPIYEVVRELRRLFDRSGVQLVGHNFRADALWLEDIGVPVMDKLAFDTMLVDHLLDESADHRLEALSVRHTTMGRYDMPLKSWLTKHGMPADGGYGDIPDELLHPYGACDADCTLRCDRTLRAYLEYPENAKIKQLFFDTVLPANQPINDMERSGLLVDADHMIDLVYRYDQRKFELIEALKKEIDKPHFNVRSFPQVVEFLFGDPADGNLGLTPIKTTEKPPRDWLEIMSLPDKERERLNPSTDAESLELLAIQEPIAAKIRDIRMVDQIGKNFLRLPDVDLDSDYDYTDLNLYRKGLVGHISERDGRIRTTISQMAETGRYRSSKPNAQNFPKRQESELCRIMGYSYRTPEEQYWWNENFSIRGCFVASPGHVLIEADYKSAEVVTLAYLSGDPQFITDATGPVKIHAINAVDLFGAPCTYEEVAKQFVNLYIAAKTVTFGIPYQRGAKAIAREINKATHGEAHCTDEDAKGYIDLFFTKYGGVKGFIEFCKGSVHNPGYLDTPYGRRRRFEKFDSNSAMAAQEREAVNFPIQSTVADALSRALFDIWAYRQAYHMDFKILLAIHDAVILEVPIVEIETVKKTVLPLCMCDMNPVPATDRNPSFKFGIDIDIMLRWGVTPTQGELIKYGVPEHVLN